MFYDLEEKAERAYKAKGFKIVWIGGNFPGAIAPTPEQFIKIVYNLKGVSDLRIDVLAHGNYFEAPPELESRFPKLNFGLGRGDRPLAVDNWDSIEGKSWHAMNLWNIRPSSEYYFLLPSVERNEFLNDYSSLDFGVGDFRIAVRAFGKNNPKGRIVLNLLNCYGGAVAQQLIGEPNLQVVAGLAIAPNIFFPPNKDEGVNTWTTTLGEYYKALTESSNSASFFESHQSITQQLLQRAKRSAQNPMSRNIEYDNYSALSFNRSAAFQSVMAFCDQDSKIKSKTYSSSNQNSVIEMVENEHQRSLDYFEEQVKTLDIPKLEKNSNACLKIVRTEIDNYDRSAETIALLSTEIKKITPAIRFQLNDPLAKIKFRKDVWEYLNEYDLFFDKVKKERALPNRIAHLTSLVNSLDGQNDLWLERALRSLSELEEFCIPNSNNEKCIIRYQILSFLGVALPTTQESDKCVGVSQNLTNVIKCLSKTDNPTRSEAKIASMILRNLSLNQPIRINPAFKENSFVCEEYSALDSYKKVKFQLNAESMCIQKFKDSANEGDWENLMKAHQKELSLF